MKGKCLHFKKMPRENMHKGSHYLWVWYSFFFFFFNWLVGRSLVGHSPWGRKESDTTERLHFIFVYFWLCWVFVAAWAFSSCGEQGPRSLQWADFSLQWLFLLWSTGCRLMASIVVVHGLSSSTPVGSSGTRNQTHVSCIGRWSLNHWTTREVLSMIFLTEHCNFWHEISYVSFMRT